MKKITSPRSVYISKSPIETKKLALRLAKMIKKGDLICLKGDLGAGKTTFVKGLAESFGIREKNIKSPTFVFLRSHKGKTCSLHHIDCYRISSAKDIQNEIFELLKRKNDTIVIEWADKIKSILPKGKIEIEFVHLSPSKRKITIYDKYSKRHRNRKSAT